MDRLNFGRGYPELDLAGRQATMKECAGVGICSCAEMRNWPERSEVCSGQEALQRSDVAVDFYLFG